MIVLIQTFCSSSTQGDWITLVHTFTFCFSNLTFKQYRERGRGGGQVVSLPTFYIPVPVQRSIVFHINLYLFVWKGGKLIKRIFCNKNFIQYCKHCRKAFNFIYRHLQFHLTSFNQFFWFKCRQERDASTNAKAKKSRW